MALKKSKSHDKLLGDITKVTLNKMALMGESPFIRALGGEANVQRAALLGLQNSDIIGLITAHLVVCRCIGIDAVTEEPIGDKSAEQIKEFKAGVTAFIDFMAACARETEKIKQKKLEQQQKAGKSLPTP
nr:MAG: hypothetical protein [Podoviridae sp. ctka020]